VLDQQKSWATQQLAQQQHLQALEQEHFHDLLHQLRNPTMAIGTFGKLLLKRLTAEDRNHTVAEGVVRESDRLKTLLQEFGEEVKFLDAQIQAIPATQTLALPSGGEAAPLRLGQTLVIETVDLRALILPIVESMGAIASERNLALRVALEPEPVLVLGNANGLIEVVSNLLENALKYTPSSGQILLAMQTLPQGVRLAVHDTGYGIPSEDLAHVFERHYRGAQAAGEIPGTGLGLAIARDFVEKMGGDLEVESPTIGLPHNATHPGSSFILWLKAAPQNDLAAS
jgi:signal transduction histidine kinase